MRCVIPYKTERNAFRSLDNGGRFFNLLTHAQDGKISSAEVGVVAGVFNNNQKMVLFLEMSLYELEELSFDRIYSSLSLDLKNSYKAYLPLRYNVPEVIEKGKKGDSVIITGVPKYVSSKSEFNGFIYVPIVTGNVTTMVLVPVVDKYDVYELRDEISSKHFFIAHSRSKTKLPEEKFRFGGFLKELKKASNYSTFLEVTYYTKL